MITQRATLVGILGFCLYLIAFVNVLPSFYLLTWLSLGILFSSLGIALLSLVGLTCEWQVAQARVAETLDDPAEGPKGGGDHESRDATGAADGDAVLAGPLLEVKLSNAGTLNKINVVMEVVLACPARDESPTRRYLLEALPSGSTLASTLPLTHLPRGRYQVQEVRLIGSDVLGLFRIRKRVSAREGRGARLAATEDNELIVGPAMISWPGAALNRGATDQGGNAGMSPMLGHSDEIRGTRPYVAGDDLRRVHWRSTARHGRLIVKEFHHAAQSQALIIWDGARTDNRAVTEAGLRLVASLARALSEAGQLYTLARFDSHPRVVTSTQLSAASAASLARVIDMLADAEAERVEPLAQVLAAHLGGLQQVNEVFLVTAGATEDVRQVAEYWRARGARVTVGLVEDSAPATPRSPRSGRRRGIGDEARENSDQAGTPVGIAGRRQALEAAGTHVVVLDSAAKAGEAAVGLANALAEMLEAPRLRTRPSGWTRRVAGRPGAVDALTVDALRTPVLDGIE